MADIKVARFSVSIFQTETNFHFASVERLRLALAYSQGKWDMVDGLKRVKYLDFEGFAGFFDYLYRTNIELFRQVIEFLLNDWMRKSGAAFPEDTEYIVDHVRALGFQYEGGRLSSTLGHDKPRIEMMSELEIMLSNINPSFCQMFRGSWEALLSDNPDRYRQAISSMRELLRQVIDELSDKQAKTRKEKVRSILGKNSDANLVEALAGTVDVMYDFQSSREHTTPDYESALFIVSETEYVLYYILKRHLSLKH